MGPLICFFIKFIDAGRMNRDTTVSEPLFHVEWMLRGVNGSLVSLSKYKGFRRFIVGKAEENNLFGTVQRWDCRDVKIIVEGSNSNVTAFLKILSALQHQSMISGVEPLSPAQSITLMTSCDFCIIKNNRKLKDNKGTIVKGIYSDDLQQYDVESVSSADSPCLQGSQIARSRSSGSSR
jgi:acylphosphatase